MRHLQMRLGAQAHSVAVARRAVADLLAEAAAEAWTDSAVLAVSEVVTNAVVHTASTVSFEAWAAPDGVRVEVGDASTHLPVKRQYALTSGTGRGLHMLDTSVDRWGAEHRPPGKVVWFELGDRVVPDLPPVDAATPSAVPDAEVRVVLRNLPLLMHWAWQEHAQALLREYLLFALETDPDAIERHAEASDALDVLHEQIPVPELPEDPDELLADAIEPGVTAEEFLVAVPRSSVSHFATLDELLIRSSEAASHGLFLGPPTQPEIAEMRRWICQEIARQSTDGAPPHPWAARTDLRVATADEGALRASYRELSERDEPILATDESSVIVAASRAVVRFLGYEAEGQLLGRRVLVVIPRRYHQAHIAGTTLNATNGRRPLLDVPLTVPVVRADGSEVPVQLRVTPRRLDEERRVFVASFDLPGPAAPAATEV